MDRIDLESRLARRTRGMGANAIREILKVVAQPGMISLAGGLPAPESFPLDIIRGLTTTVLDRYGSRALQYDATEGFGPLREALVPYLATKGVVAEVGQITVFNGSQSVLDILSKILIDPGDTIAIEAPSYLGAISAFNAYEPSYAPIMTDDEGILPDDLDRVLTEHEVSFVYLIPTFQNPTGRTLPAERRRRIAEIVRRHDVLLLEDDPYSALRYSGEHEPPIHAFAPEHVVYMSTFSKILSPGLRIGFSVAPRELARWLVIAKQGVDLHTNTFSQAIAAEYLAGGHLDAYLPRILELYAARRQAMFAALDGRMPPGYRWTEPEGGMFIWVQGPEDVDAVDLYHRCVAEGVAFVPGKFFFIEDVPGASATLRLNFTNADLATIEHAVGVIGRAAAEVAGDVAGEVAV